MRFSLSLISIVSLSLLSASSLAHPQVSPTPGDDLQLRDTHESGLETLGARSHERKSRHVQMAENSKRDKPFLSKWGRVTYYAGNQLDNPSCGGSTPTDNDAICAVPSNMGMGSCGQTMHIHWKGKMAKCKIVDTCAGCNYASIDVSKSVFKQLDSLKMGVLEGDGLHFRLVN